MSSTLRFPAGVPPLIRRRGEDYFRHRAASLVSRDGRNAAFTVRGTRPYRVTLTVGGDILHATCDCPYAADRDTVCKHIWAALLEARRVGAVPEVDGVFRLQAGSAEPKTGGGPSAWEETIGLLAPPEGEEKATRPLPAALVGGDVVYVLDEETDAARGTGAVIRLLARARKQNGAWARPRSLSLTAAQADGLPREDDRRILALLGGAGSDLWSRWAWHGTPLANPARLHPEAASVLLPALCETGRFFLEEPSDASVPLAWDPGEPWRFGLVVDAGSDGKGWLARGALQRDDAHLDLAALTRVLGPGFLLSQGRISRFAPAGVHRLLRHLAHRDAIEVAAAEGVRFVAALLAQHPRVALTVPEALQFEECAADPRPEIRILESRRQWVPSRLHAHLSFDYEGTRVAPKDAAEGLVDPDHRRLLRRDREAEAKAVARLHALGFRPPPRFWSEGDAPDFELSERHLPRAVRALLSEGWRVEAENLRYRAPGRTSLRVASGVDWFEVRGEVDFEGQVVPLPALLRALREGQGFVTLGDGTFGLLPEDWLRRHARLAELGRLEQTGVRFAPAQVAVLDALLSGLPEATWDATFARARRRLEEFTGIAPRDPARAFRGTLRRYQREGLGWLHFLREFGFGGCLADDMGLGKTVQVLALLSRSRKRGDRLPSLVVVPRSLVFNWKEEAARFAPHLKVLDHTGLDRPRSPADLQGADLVLTTYGTLRRDAHWLAAIEFDYAILDEAQAIKNPQSQAAKAARLLRARHRLALSGTPIENHLGELWSLFEFLNPGMLGASPAFRLGEEALRHPEGEARTLLARALRPFVLRRTKAQVAPDLPARTEQTLWCTLGEEQRTRYDELREHYRSSLLRAIEHHGMAKAKIQVLEALLRLRQAACHPGLLDPDRRSAASAKLEALLPHLSEVVEAGHKAIVFSQFTSFLALLRPLLEAKEIPYAYLDGQTGAASRKGAVSRFQEDAACPVFLISLKAGGLGLNLTAAEYVYLLDPWWNPAVEAQAVDRAHRIGQTRPVFAYRLVARDTVEEKILELQASKRALADAILGQDAGLLRKMTREDVERLLG